MDFDELMELIEGDEEMGEMELFGCDGLIDIRTNEGKKVLHIHFYAAFANEYDLVKEVLDLNGVKYYITHDVELKSEKITVDADATCVFARQEESGADSDFIARDEGAYIELADTSAHLQIMRKDGKKKLEIAFFIWFEEYKILNSFLNLYDVNFHEFYDEFMGEQLKVQLDVKCSFLPKKAKSE